MSLGQIIVLTAIVAAFVVFAAVLAWGDYCAQQSVRRVRDQGQKDAAGADGRVKHGTAQARWPRQSQEQLRHVA